MERYEETEEEIVEETEKLLYHKVTDEKGYRIRIQNGVYIIEGPFVERLLASVNIRDNESLKYFQRVVRKKGIIDELKQMGINDGDTVKMDELEFEYFD